MKFINEKNETILMRIDGKDGYEWKFIEPNQIIEINAELGYKYDLTIVEDNKLEEVKEEVEVKENIKSESIQVKADKVIETKKKVVRKK